MNKRDFLKTASIAAAVTAVNAPAVIAQSKSPIRWRLQTYAGASLAEHVVKPATDSFNKIANGDMTIDLFTADQLVPMSDLFNALQKGTLDALQSDDDSMASPVDVAVFGGYFPFATRYSLDVPALFHQSAGKFLSRFGIVPVTLPWDEVKDAVRNGALVCIARFRWQADKKRGDCRPS